MADEATPIDSAIEIVTPENIAFKYQVAGPFRRLPAFLIDLGIRLSAVVALSFLLSFVSIVPGLGAMSQGAVLVTWFLLSWFYGGLFEALMNGQTPGKRLLGLRVLTTRGQPINGLQAVMRNVLRTADMMPWVSLYAFVPPPFSAIWLPTGILGLAAAGLNQRHQRLGDLACGTMVISEERHWLTGVAKLEDPRVPKLAEFIPADFEVNRTLARALSHYVERRRFLMPVRRAEVASYLAEPLLRRFGLPSDTSYDLLLCALYHRAFVAGTGDAARNGDEAHTESAGASNPTPSSQQRVLTP